MPCAPSCTPIPTACLKDILPLLVLLRALVRLVVLPPHRLLALSTKDVADNVSARRHVALVRLASFDVDDVVEEVGFSVLAAEVLVEGKLWRLDAHL